MKKFVSIPLSLFFLLGGISFLENMLFSPVEKHFTNVYALTSNGEFSQISTGVPSVANPSIQDQNSQKTMGEMMGGMKSGNMERMMGENMKNAFPPKVMPFYKEKTFLVIITVALMLIVVWMIKRWGRRSWRVISKQNAFVNEAIFVVDLCGSTKLAVTQGDVFAMRIKNKMKACVHEVSEAFQARYFENTGDGYMITFPSAIDAVRAAVKILQKIEDYNKDIPQKEKIGLRIGIHYGELVFDEQGGRHGASINKAFRIEGLKKEQQQDMSDGLKPEEFPEKNRIFVSEEINEEIKDDPEILVKPVGIFDLKGFTGLHRTYYIPWKDLPRN